MLQNNTTNESKKRKADEIDGDCDSKEQGESKEIESEKNSENAIKSEKDECSKSEENQQKSDNGGSSEGPGSSNNKQSDAETKDSDNQSSESQDKKTKLDGSDTAGTLLFSGGTNWDLIGRTKLLKNVKEATATGTNLWSPHRLSALQGIRVTSAHSGPTAVHSVVIAEGGKAYVWGKNDKGQLGLCDQNRRDVPTLVDTLKDTFVVSASCGRGHTLFLTDKGTVYACGDNKMGQCGIGSQNTPIKVPTKISFKGRSIAKVACGAEFSVIVDVKGGMYSFGSPEYGQLGHNTDGRYFETSKKVSYKCELVPRRVVAFIEKTREGHVTLLDDVQIVCVACGTNHTVAVDSKNRCYSYGFGGFGRLGHAEAKDEMVPRLIKALDGPGRGAKKVFAGGAYSMAVNVHDVLYFWGQNNRSGEATLYPKPVQDLMGWQVRDVGTSLSSIVVIADESVISWGPSPTYGELGYGESRPKSSTTPQEVKPLDGIHINSVAMGHGFSLLIARDDTEEDRKKLEQLPEHTP